jgi:hypothetical protein
MLWLYFNVNAVFGHTHSNPRILLKTIQNLHDLRQS